jgi:tetratricopeptide (TPR) repeat protein
VARSARAATKADRLIEAVEKLSRELAEGLSLKLPELTQEQIDKSPEANLHFMRGLGHYFANMPDHAIACFMKALASDPAHARARFWNGKTYLDQGEHEHARIELDRFLKQFPKHELAPQAKAMAAKCTTETEKRKPGERK